MKFLVTMILTSMISSSLLADGAGTTNAGFLKIPIHARPAAMGSAYSALSDDEGAFSFNPAGIANALQTEISATHIEWFQSIAIEHFGGVFPLTSPWTFGAYLTWLNFGDIARTERTNPFAADPAKRYTDTGTFSPHDLALGFAFARPIYERMALGAQLNLVDEDINSEAGIGVDLSLGGQYLGVWRDLDLGVQVRNLAIPLQVGSYPLVLPMTVAGGACYGFDEHRYNLLLDLALPSDEGISISTGGEAWFFDMLAARVGYKLGAVSQLTAGAGLRYERLRLDYAYVPYGDLGPTHRLTAALVFGNPFARLDADHKIVAPVGEPEFRNVVLTPHLRSPIKLRSWEVQVVGSEGQVYKTVKGKAPLPAKVPWDGKDAQGRLVPDGDVHAELAGTYQGGIGTIPVPRPLEVDTLPPDLNFGMEPKVIYTNTEGAVQIPASISLKAADIHGVGAWKLEVKDTQGRLVKSFGGEGQPPAAVTWDGMDENGRYIQSGQTYVSVLSAKDKLGNWSQSAPQSQVVLLREIHLNVAADTQFEPGRADLDPSNFQQLKAIAASITQYWKPGTVIEVIGHTDSIPIIAGRYANNQELSVARAQAVVAALKTYLGPQAAWLQASGRGDTQPVADNGSAEGRAKNRRVDIIVKTQNNRAN